MAQADIPILKTLYDKLDVSMQDANKIIDEVSSALNNANSAWRSRGADEFNAAWSDFERQLVRMSQAFAAAATEVGDQHNTFAIAAREEHLHPQLPKVTSPR